MCNNDVSKTGWQADDWVTFTFLVVIGLIAFAMLVGALASILHPPGPLGIGFFSR